MANTDVQYYLERAKVEKDKKDFFTFVKNISIAEYLAGDDKELKKQLLLEEADGLLRFYQYREALEIIEDALKFVDSHETRLELLHQKGWGLVYLGKIAEAYCLYKELAKEEYIKIKVWSLISLVWILSLRFEDEPKPEYLEEALIYGREALSLARDYDPVLYARALRNCGVVYWYRNDYERALSHFLEASALYEDKNVKVLNNIAATYISTQEVDLARKYLEEAEKLAEAEKNTFEIGQSHFIRARLEEELYEDYTIAKDLYLTAYDNYIDANSFIDAFKVMKKLSYLTQKHDEESLAVFAKKFAPYAKKEKHSYPKEQIFPRRITISKDMMTLRKEEYKMKKLITLALAALLIATFSLTVLADPTGGPGSEDSYVKVVVKP